MKILTILIVVMALLTAAGFGPFRAEDTQRLNPVQTLVATFTEQGVKLEGENGQKGWGADFVEAVEDLKQSSVGIVFLQTAQKLVAIGADMADLTMTAMSGILRPAAELFTAEKLVDAAQANDYLQTRSSPVTVGELQTAAAQAEMAPALPEITEINGASHEGSD